MEEQSEEDMKTQDNATNEVVEKGDGFGETPHLDEISEGNVFKEEDHLPSADELIAEDIRIQEEGKLFEGNLEVVEFNEIDVINVDTGLPFMTDTVFKTEAEATDWINNVGRIVGVVLVRGRSDYSEGRNPYIKLICERGGDRRPNHRAKSYAPKSTGERKLKPRQSCTKKCGCEFLIVLKKDKKIDGWTITVRNGIHNHSLNQAELGHAFKGRLKADEKELVARLTKSGLLPKVIRKELKELNPLNTTSAQTIYNERVKLKKGLRDNRTVIQEVFHLAQTHPGGVFLRYTTTDKEEIENLFWAQKNSLVLARLFPLVFMVDCTYKTNFYKLPLLHIVGVTCTDLTFSVGFAYLWAEKKANYEWALRQLRNAVEQSHGSVPKVIVTDRELALMDDVSIVFPESSNLICRWHIQKAVRAKVRPGNKETECKNIMNAWNKLVWSETEEDFNVAVEGMKMLVRNDIFLYMDSTWLCKYKERFVSVWTNKVIHLGNTQTSRVEGAHAVLKNWLGTANCDMATGWNAVASLCEQQWNNVMESFEISRTKWPTNKFQDKWCRYLRGHVSIHALDLLKEEVDRCLTVGESVEMCACVLRQTHGLPCAHEISTMLKENSYIPRTSLHVHWRTLYIEGRPCEDDVDPNPYIADFRSAFDLALTTTGKLEYIQRLREATLPSVTSLSQPPVKLNPRGRPSKRKSKWTDECSTKRVPSLFEFVEEAALKADAEADADAEKVCADVECQPHPQTEVVVRHVFEMNVTYVHEKFREFVLDIQDVEADGNCGYRSIAVALGRPEEDYRSIRQELVHELKSNLELYDALFKLKGYTLDVIRGVDWKHGKCKNKYWMETPTMLWPIAEKYNAVVVLFSEGILDGTNLTCFPTRQPPNTLPPIVICLLYRKLHYVCVKLKDDCPLPTLMASWGEFASEFCDAWMKLFRTRLEAGRALLGFENVQPEIIEL